MFKQMLNISNEATQSKWDNLTAWVYSTCTQVPESMIYHGLVIVNDVVVLHHIHVKSFKILFKKLLKRKRYCCPFLFFE